MAARQNWRMPFFWLGRLSWLWRCSAIPVVGAIKHNAVCLGCSNRATAVSACSGSSGADSAWFKADLVDAAPLA